MENHLVFWLLAAAPIIFFLIVMLVFKWGGSRAGAFAWLATAAIAWLFFGADLTLIGYTYVKGFLLALDVLVIIWTAMFFFLLMEKAGAVQTIGAWLSALTSNRASQGILLGWLFPSFLQGIGGFGVPVAVSAPLLVSSGFSPVRAIVMASVGHAWGITFGSMASSFQALIAVSGLPGPLLAPASAFLLGTAALACGVLVCFIADGWQGVSSMLPHTLLLGGILGAGQYLLAANRLWIISVTVPALASLVSGLFLLRKNHRHAPGHGKAKPEDSRSYLALIPYGLLVIVTLAVNLIRPLNHLLNQYAFTLNFPEITTRLGDITPAGPGRDIRFLTHPAAMIALSALASYGLFSGAGLLHKDDFWKTIRLTAIKSADTSVAIFTMVGIATIMSHTRMTVTLAEGIAAAFGNELFPISSPFIGALGAFITGNNTNSNVLFASIQMRSAELLGLSVPLILAAQTAGGAIGSMMAPAKIILACATVGLENQEGMVISRILIYGLVLIGMMSLLTLLLSRFGFFYAQIQ